MNGNAICRECNQQLVMMDGFAYCANCCRAYVQDIQGWVQTACPFCHHYMRYNPAADWLYCPLCKVRQNQNKANNIQHPAHYTAYPVEVINMIREVLVAEYGEQGFEAYCLGNEIKYRMRAGLKGDVAEDIGKAEQYRKFRSA